ncbi:MAG TPA: hypothetical protein VKB69_11565 [Micromonosporaceae bacterium]|nr:hypothetical protein [Micromonosporaceae bacterium]
MHVSASPARHTVARPALAVLVIALLSLAACGGKNKSGSGALGSQSGAPSVSPTAGGTATPTNTPTTSVTTTATSTASSADGGPKIVDFSIKQQPACPIVGTSDAPFHQDGVDIIVQWKVTGASGVALSLDSPDFFKQYGTGSIGSYGPTGEMHLPFTCEATNGPNTTHTYTLNTKGGGPSVARTLTVTKPTNP